MFEQFYGFTRTPFGRDLEPSELYHTDQHKEMLARMRYTAERRSFALFTGEVGSGKSTAARLLANGLHPAKYVVLYITDSDLTPRNFYYEALHQLGHLPRFYRGDAKRQLNRAIIDLYENQKKVPIIIIDEGHLLKRPMLEEIRFLTNFRMDSFSPMSLLLLGQPELKRILNTQIYEAIVQRLGIRFHLDGMSRDETQGYIAHHLKITGVTNEIFTDMAIDVVHQFTQGVPRKINNVCCASLLSGFAERKSLIDDYLVRQVLEIEFAA
jgi:type II secretory pathway predicted ATPase ExeA